MTNSPPEKIESVIVRLMTRRKWTLALAESCTGGLIAHRITNVPGASKIFRGGVVAYSNDAKQKFLGVRSRALARHGAVSQAVAREMALGAQKRFRADFAIAVTGIAGPSGGTKVKPVGTVFIALTGKLQTGTVRKLNPLSRELFKRRTAEQALSLLLQRIRGKALCA